MRNLAFYFVAVVWLLCQEMLVGCNDLLILCKLEVQSFKLFFTDDTKELTSYNEVDFDSTLFEKVALG